MTLLFALLDALKGATFEIALKGNWLLVALVVAAILFIFRAL